MSAPARLDVARDEAARRTVAPFGRRRLDVVENRAVGAYRVLIAPDPLGPAPRPGQFYMLAAAAEWGGGDEERPYLPRAFSFMRHRGDHLEFILEDVGPGTHRLGSLRAGEGLLATGPLGLGFAPPEEGRRPLHVGGGIGVAPLACWQDEVGGPALLGFRSGAHAQAAALLSDVRLATDDGSAGRRALVTQLLREELDGDAAVTVYACGPPAMLEAVRALTADRGVPAQLAMESGMACGFGACFGCVVPTRSGYVRLCVEGPVVDAAALETALVSGSGH
jgi:dihydroorotate dehydrogenase electron transfer subunit